MDQPMRGIDKVVWWTEYVIRHGGAKHLRNPAADLPWYQYFLLDVAAVFLAFLALVVILFVILWKMLRKVLSKILEIAKPMKKTSPRSKKSKTL